MKWRLIDSKNAFFVPKNCNLLLNIHPMRIVFDRKFMESISWHKERSLATFPTASA